VVVPLLVVVGLALPAGQATLFYLGIGAAGRPSPAARSTGHDALWLGHAWVDGRRTQSDVDALAERLRSTGIRDLFVHAGPFSDDGSLDAGLRPRARWLTDALHAALPGVRVQAWLGAHPTEEELHLWEPAVRTRLVRSVGEVLDDGFDGIHYDFEPVEDGDPHLLAILRETRPVTRSRGALLSISAIHIEPFAGPAAVLRTTGLPLSLWSAGYLREVARLVDQVALMSYDTAMPTEALYCGYMHRSTARALAAVPPEVGLLIGVPAYPPEGIYHHAAENMATAIRGIRLALGDRPPDREFGIAIYVDFTATEADWSVYLRDWFGSGSQSVSGRTPS
jgi:hypothetical protein